MVQNTYYDAHSIYPSNALKVGWRHEIEQVYYFEVVLRFIEDKLNENNQLNDNNSIRLLDLGCGTGRFYTYLMEHPLLLSKSQSTPHKKAIIHCFIDYLGVDYYPHTLEPSFPDKLFLQTDYFEHPFLKNEFDFVIAIGTLTSGEEHSSSEAEKLFHRTTNLLKYCANNYILIATDLNEYYTKNIIPDPLVGGVQHEWISTKEYCRKISSDHLAITNKPFSFNKREVFWRTVRRTPSRSISSEAAWLAFQLEEPDWTRAILSSGDGLLDPLGELLLSRLE